MSPPFLPPLIIFAKEVTGYEIPVLPQYLFSILKREAGIGKQILLHAILQQVERGTYDAIILPGSYETGKLTVEFTINNETFVWDVEKTHWFTCINSRKGIKSRSHSSEH